MRAVRVLRTPAWATARPAVGREDLAVVDGSRRDEAECLVETGWTAIAKRVTGQQFGATLASNQVHDLSHDLTAVAEALVTVVDEQLPQKPRADDAGRLRVDIPSQHDKPDRQVVGVDSPGPWVRLGDLGGLCQRADHRGHEPLLLRSCTERSNRIGVAVRELSKADRHIRHATPSAVQ